MMNPIEFINIVPFNPLISKCQIKVCWVGEEPNPNKSIISRETAKGIANSIPGSPIVGYYNEEKEDFEGHNKIIEIRNGKISLKPTTRPYGFVDLNAKVWFQKFMDSDGEHEYMVTEGWLWTGQFPECQRVIEQGNNQSMELDQNLIDAYWTKDRNGKNEFFIINEAIMSKLCILGEDVRPCFEGADITAPKIDFSLDEDFKTKLFSMMEEIKNNIIKEGGITDMEGENKVLENAATDEKKEDICPECGKPMSECICKKTENACGGGSGAGKEDDKDEKKKEFAEEPKKDKAPKKGEEEKAPKKEEEGEKTSEEEGEKTSEEEDDKKDKGVKYTLEEIPEYMELNEKFEKLSKEFNDLKNNYSALETEKNSLAEFKNSIEKTQKEEMIKSFYMLDDEAKKDVVEHINEYSLDEIESKLSVICVRNKVSFDIAKNSKEEDAIVYNLNTAAEDNSGSNPAWVNAVVSRSKNK